VIWDPLTGAVTTWTPEQGSYSRPDGSSETWDRPQPDPPGEDAMIVAQGEDGRTWTIPRFDTQDVRKWEEANVQASGNLRAVVDQHGNWVTWNPDTGEVTTVQRVDKEQYQVSKTELEF
jgi:hypothetical protein